LPLFCISLACQMKENKLSHIKRWVNITCLKEV
jgi:hypothetical protein